MTDKKDRPIHKIQPTKSIVAYTWCGVDPYRKGVLTEGVRGESAATCKECLMAEARAKASDRVRKPVAATRVAKKPLLNEAASALAGLIEAHGIGEVLAEIRSYAYSRDRGADPTWGAIHAIIAEAAGKVEGVKRDRERAKLNRRLEGE